MPMATTWAKRFKDHGAGKTNADYVVAMRSLSNSINQAGIHALRAVTQQLIKAIHPAEKGRYEIRTPQGNIPLNQQFLPFRPLVYGGDDITFVCDGRLGLTLAAAYLRAFEAQVAADKKPLRACGGISIVKVHYPFARAYETSEALCQSAKRFVRDRCEEAKSDEESFSALDWHITASGLNRHAC